MKLQLLTALLTLAACTSARGVNDRRGHRRQAGTNSSSSSAAVSSSATASVAASGASSASSASVSGAISLSATASVPTGTAAPATGSFTVPPLSSIMSGMPTQVTETVTWSYSSGSTATYSGAPPIPTPFVFNISAWPAQDKHPDTSSPEVQEWLKELDGWNIPDIDPTTDGTCANDPSAAADAESRGWWTCGGWTRETDIVACPEKYTWGVSFDDGPSPYSKPLLDFLDEKDIQATFFTVGSRVIERPNVLIEEYMKGHEISVHTWSHPYLTSLSTAEIVAELGWTRKAIKTVLGVTPTTMRPPYGDIDDRVRAISLAMGLVPIIWTRTPSGGQFDTNDWRVPGGLVTGPQSFQTFQNILNNATAINTGFIVLEHDLFQQTVDLAIGYTLPLALSFTPKLTLEPIGKCSKIPTANMYLETNKNTSFPYNQTSAAKASSSSNSTSSSAGSASFMLPVSMAGVALAASLASLAL